MLRIRSLDAGYGRNRVLHGVALDLRAGEVHCLVGRNGAGKTTLLRAIMGLATIRGGELIFNDTDLAALPPHRIPLQGIGYVPQGRRLFADLTVAENLEIGLMARQRGRKAYAHVLELFPILAERLQQMAGTLSGGEQQMLAIARALCLEPGILLMDEPSEGLQPSMIARIGEVIAALREAGVAILLVEQRVATVHALADRVSFIENGRMQETVEAAELAADSNLFQRYVGIGS
ncbi:MAG TPA: ABC transporter ATP-binding protein [Paracoccaceae bacterium]|nr:ABC transporter ATP-binding protein [Paracoccaceae bacterium]